MTSCIQYFREFYDRGNTCFDTRKPSRYISCSHSAHIQKRLDLLKFKGRLDMKNHLDQICFDFIP